MTLPEFHSPAVLALLALVIPAAIVSRRRAGVRALPMPGLSQLRLKMGWRARVQRLELPLQCIALSLLIIALARPQLGFEVTEETREGVDIMMGLDISYSMLARDFTPNRLTVAKALAVDFVKRLDSDRIGLVVFAGASFTQSPLTFDYDGLVELIDRIETGMMGVEGTAIGDALANCVYRFQDDEERTKVVVFLTDGQQTAGYLSPVDGARLAETKGVRVYTIGVGSLEGVPIPMPPPFEDEIATDRMGRPVMTQLDEDTLKEIARITGGQYFRAEDEGELSEVLATIAELEKTEATVRQVKQYQERANWFLVPGVALLALQFLLFRGLWRVVR